MNFEIDTPELIRALDAVIPFASPDGTLPMINVVHVHCDTDWAYFTATDRYIAGQWRAPIDLVGSTIGSTLIPLAECKRILRVMKPALGMKRAVGLPIEFTSVSGDGSSIKLEQGAGQVVMTMRPFVATYPDVAALIDNTVGEPAPEIAFRPTAFAPFARLAGKHEHMRISFHGANKPAGVLVGERFRGLLMPYRLFAKDGDESAGNYGPSWGEWK